MCRREALKGITTTCCHYKNLYGAVPFGLTPNYKRVRHCGDKYKMLDILHCAVSICLKISCLIGL